jgi:hypothetical protein
MPSLPEEIVSEIFRHLPVKTLLECSLVCHRWRRVSIERSTLWTYITDIGWLVRQGRGTIERSGNLPLTLDFSMEIHSLRDTRIHDNLSKVLNRTRNILHICSASLRDLPHAPDLVTLSVTDDSHRHENDFLEGYDELQHLAIKVSLLRHSTDRKFSPHLKTLHLHDQLPPLHLMLLALSHLPALKELVLQDRKYPKEGPDGQLVIVDEPTLGDEEYSRAIFGICSLPKLNFLKIKGYTARDLSRILDSSLIHLSTNVFIVTILDQSTPLSINCRNKDSHSSLWVRSRGNTLLIVQDAIFTEITVRQDIRIGEVFLSLIPGFVNSFCRLPVLRWDRGPASHWLATSVS